MLPLNSRIVLVRYTFNVTKPTLTVHLNNKVFSVDSWKYRLYHSFATPIGGHSTVRVPCFWNLCPHICVEQPTFDFLTRSEQDEDDYGFLTVLECKQLSVHSMTWTGGGDQGGGKRLTRHAFRPIPLPVWMYSS